MVKKGSDGRVVPAAAYDILLAVSVGELVLFPFDKPTVANVGERGSSSLPFQLHLFLNFCTDTWQPPVGNIVPKPSAPIPKRSGFPVNPIRVLQEIERAMKLVD